MSKYLTILGLLAVLFISGCGSSGNTGCNVSNCHGLTVQCDFVDPPICTEVYELGDKCRALVSCVEEQGSCISVEAPGYQECKQCIEVCIAAGVSTDAQFNCEANC